MQGGRDEPDERLQVSRIILTPGRSGWHGTRRFVRISPILVVALRRVRSGLRSVSQRRQLCRLCKLTSLSCVSRKRPPPRTRHGEVRGVVAIQGKVGLLRCAGNGSFTLMRRLVLLLSVCFPTAPQLRSTAPPPSSGGSILIYSGTTGYRHDSIPAGIKAVSAMAARRGLTVVASEDPAVFSASSLKRFKAIVLLELHDRSQETGVRVAGRRSARCAPAVRAERRRHRRHPCRRGFALQLAMVRAG